MGHVPHGREHDADVPPRSVAQALSGRRLAGLVAFDVAALLVVAALLALSAWQIERRAWKLELLARIEARAHAAPVPAPGPDRWADVSAGSDEYRRVEATGRWLGHRTAFVQALTELGSGYWALTPLSGEDGTVILINRGFVPPGGRDPAGLVLEQGRRVTVTGLLRMSEPGGAFLRSNDPAADRWFSRDVAAIAASRGIAGIAPFFIDAERAPGPASPPVGGLTVLAFPNNHLVYALTWAALATMAAAGAVLVNREVLRRRPAVLASEPGAAPSS